jgi:hypothetical protein
MRGILLMIVAFIALGACQNGGPEQQMAEPQEAVSSGPAGGEPETLLPLCPLRWSCNDESYYFNRSQCQAHCDGTCFYGPDCRGNCICE